jgi:hypothetical protein
MPAIKWSTVERPLASMDQPEPITLLRDLFKSSDTARTFLALRVLGGDGGETLEKYRKRVVGQFFPARGDGQLDLREARRSIREYQKTTADLAGTIDLLLTSISVNELSNRHPLCPKLNNLQLLGDVPPDGSMVGSLACPLGHFHLDDPWIEAWTTGPVNPTACQQGQ